VSEAASRHQVPTEVLGKVMKPSVAWPCILLVSLMVVAIFLDVSCDEMYILEMLIVSLSMALGKMTMEMIQQPDTFASRHRGFTRSILTSAQGLVASCLQCWVLLISTEKPHATLQIQNMGTAEECLEECLRAALSPSSAPKIFLVEGWIRNGDKAAAEKSKGSCLAMSDGLGELLTSRKNIKARLCAAVCPTREGPTQSKQNFGVDAAGHSGLLDAGASAGKFGDAEVFVVMLEQCTASCSPLAGVLAKKGRCREVEALGESSEWEDLRANDFFPCALLLSDFLDKAKQMSRAVVAATCQLEINELLVQKAYCHNFGSKDWRKKTIECLRHQDLDALAADVWLMSPPCQPFTRSGKRKDHEDDRSRGLLHLVSLLPEMHHPPHRILLENVIGFERSECRRRLVQALATLGWELTEFALDAEDFGLPNRRPRYYGLFRSPLRLGTEAPDEGPPDIDGCVFGYRFRRK
ncbi:TRDMT1, partial [Symbiodinium sp. KB8]